MTIEQAWPLVLLFIAGTLCLLIIIAIVGEVLDRLFESWFRHKATSQHFLNEMRKEDQQIYGKGSHE